MRRKKKQLPRLEATALIDTAALASLRKLSDEALAIELTNATTTEAWLWTTEAALRADPGEPTALADLAERGASYCRISREVMLIFIADRVEEKKAKDEKKKGNGQGPPSAYL
jgi:hypothetical protein